MSDIEDSPEVVAIRQRGYGSKSIDEMRAEIGVQPWSCWVTYYWDCGVHIAGVYGSEIDALRCVNEDSSFLKAKQVFAGEVVEQLK